MNRNMGQFDRVFRAVVAAVLVLLYFTNIISGTLGIILLAVGVIFLLTSMMGFCPLYFPFKISTKSRPKDF